jgi:hypothetical protein
MVVPPINPGKVTLIEGVYAKQVRAAFPFGAAREW